MFAVEKRDDIIIPDAHYWAKLRGAYRKAKESVPVVDDDEDNDDPWLKAAMEREWPLTGAQMEFEIRLGQHGRGVFSKENIPAGKVVWNCQHCGVFRTEQQWHTFLNLLPPHMQYDVVIWAFAWDGVLYLDLEPASMFNHGGSVIEDEGAVTVMPTNLTAVEINPDEDEWQYVAKVDIKVGDELFCDYSEFHDYDNPLPWFIASHKQVVDDGIYY
jgi:hypothetical protein